MTEATHHPKILVLAGSSRLDSIHRKLARQTVEALRDAGVEATLADLRDFPMPIYDGDLEAGQGLPTAAKALKELARAARRLRHRVAGIQRILPCPAEERPGLDLAARTG